MDDLRELTKDYLDGHISWSDYRAREKIILAEHRLTQTRSDVHHAIQTGSVTDDDFRRLGEAYEASVRARTT